MQSGAVANVVQYMEDLSGKGTFEAEFVAGSDGERVAFILKQLLRKPFRRRVSIDTRLRMARKIASCVQLDRPIVFTIPFGGYKHFWNPSHPRPDWAEHFHVRMMIDYVSPVLAAHSAGVSIEYISEDLIVPRMNNYPLEATEEYARCFRELLDWYGHLLPGNLRLEFWRLQERYDGAAIESAVEATIPSATAAFGLLPPHLQEHELIRSKRSVYWRGPQELGRLRPSERHRRIIEARLFEKSFAEIAFGPEFVGGYYNDDDRIMLCFSWGLSTDNFRGFLALQTCPGSGVDFWIGRGVLVRAGDRLRHSIVSRRQYESMRPFVSSVDLREIRDRPPGQNFENMDVVTPQGVE